MTQTPVQSLQGQFLLAMPNMGDPRFLRSVVYMVAHDSEARWALLSTNAPKVVVGGYSERHAQNCRQNRAGQSARICRRAGAKRPRICLHTSDYEKTHNTLSQELPIALTQSADVLVDAAHGRGPEKMRLFWATRLGPGQIEGELQDNAWLVCDANIADILPPKAMIYMKNA